MEIILILLAAGAYFVFSLYKMRLALVLMPLFFPLYLIKDSLFGIPFTLVEALIYAVFLAFAFRRIYDNFAPKKKFVSFFSNVKNFFVHDESFLHRYKYLLIGVFGLVLAAFLSLVATERELVLIDGRIFYGGKIALGILKGWIIAPVIYFLLLIEVLRDRKSLLTLMNAYSISAVILALWGVFQLITQNYITPDARVSGPFESANYLALYIAPAFLYLAARVHDTISSIEKGNRVNLSEISFILTGTLVLFVALLSTKSYAAMIAVFIAALFCFGLQYREYFLKKKKEGFWKYILWAVGIIALVLVLVFAIDPSKWQAMFQFGQRNSSSVRIEVYTIAWDLIVNNWFFGIGMGQFPALYQIEAVTILGHVPYEWNMLHPHNLFLAMWLNLGVLGLLSFIFLLGVSLRQTWPYFKSFALEKITDTGKLRVLGFLLLIVIFVHGFFDTPFFKNDLSLLFWTILAVIFVRVEGRDK